MKHFLDKRSHPTTLQTRTHEEKIRILKENVAQVLLVNDKQNQSLCKNANYLLPKSVRTLPIKSAL